MTTKPFADTYSEQCSLINPEKPVRCYRNLHRKCWSIKQGVVRFHCHKIFLKNAEFLVNERLRQKVLAEKRKTVHAFVYGWLTFPPTYFTEGPDCGQVYYNPYKHSTFVSGNTPVHHAELCCMVKRGDKMIVTIDNPSIRYAKMLASDNTDCTMCETVQTHLL